VDAYREYLKSNPLDPDQLEADRAQAIKELYEYVEEVHKEEVEETAVAEQATTQAQRTDLVRLNLNPKKGPNNIVNTVRIFNVLHELDFFSDAHGNKISKKDLGEALATIFNCPGLSKIEWTDRLAASRGKDLSDHRAQFKIFQTLLDTQKKIIKDLDEKAEERYW
jgi:hypothetical protein